MTDIWHEILTALTGSVDAGHGFNAFLGLGLDVVAMLIRIFLPILAILIIVRAAKSLFGGKNEPETWAWLVLGNEVRLPVNHWENIIGRGTSSDILMNLPTISRSHAALIRDASGKWTVTDLAGKDSITVNGNPVHGTAEVVGGDLLSLGGCDMVLTDLTPEEAKQQSKNRTRPGKSISPQKTLGWLTLFVVLLTLELIINCDKQYAAHFILAFSWLLLIMWLIYFAFRGMRRTGYEIETLAFFLCSIGFAVISSAAPDALFKQCVSMSVGVAGFIVLGWLLRDLRAVKALRWPVAGAALLLLLLTFVFGVSKYGARNWLVFGGYSFQPSELVKVAFVFAGAATLDRLFSRRNLYSFIGLSAVILGALALMGDFGTAAIFFVGFLIIAFIRSGDLATIALSCAGAGFAGFLALTIKPYIANRFAVWGHAWEFASTTGYQQTRTMCAAASGGFFGIGAGDGWLKNIAASDTDLVFGMLCEELGLIIAVTAVAALIIAALFAVKSSYNARSSYYVIAACASAGLLVFQMMLNICGSLDLLPLTGVTFPFVSNGGSSMISAWMLLAFLKAADTRQNASFAIALPRFSRKGGHNK